MVFDNTTRTVLILLSVFTGAYFLIKFWHRQRHIRKLASKIPGPKAYPLLGNILDVLAWTPGETVQKYKRIAQTYSPTVCFWIGPQLAIVVSDPRDLEILMNSRKCLGRDRTQKIFDKYPLGDGLIAIGGEQWKIHRKFVLQSFTYNNFESFVKVFDQNSKILVDCLKVTSNSNKSINILDYLKKFTFDSICENMMGVKTSSQKKKQDEYIDSLTTYLYIFTNMVMKPWLLIPIFIRLASYHKKMTRSTVFMNMFCDEIVSRKTKDYREQSKDITKKEQLESSTKINRPTLLESMIKLIENNECSFSKKEITGEINFMLWAGMDTTSTSLSFTMMLLGFHQDVQRKVQEELDVVFGDDVERSVTIEDLNNLKYTEQVIKESLRLYPVVPIIPRTSTEDIKITSHTIPKGCDVFFNIYSLHRNPKIYPNPDEFDPENFSPERSKGRHPYSFLPFSGGLRKCVGYKYAMFQMKIVLATVLRHFTVHPACDRKEIEQWDLNLVLKLVNGFKIKLVSKN